MATVPAQLVALDRTVIEELAQAKLDEAHALIALLDRTDGNPDTEPDGDEIDGNFAEDDFCEHASTWLREPGCPISDPGGCEHDGREEEQGV